MAADRKRVDEWKKIVCLAWASESALKVGSRIEMARFDSVEETAGVEVEHFD
jgi:hypothetical protein